MTTTQLFYLGGVALGVTALSFAAGFGLGVTFQTGARHVETRVVLQKR